MNAIKVLFESKYAENIVAVRQVRPGSFHVQPMGMYLDILAKRIQKQGTVRRQDDGIEITPSGGFYIAKWENFKQTANFYTEKTLSYLVPDMSALEIDEDMDWAWAEFLIEKSYVDIKDIISL